MSTDSTSCRQGSKTQCGPQSQSPAPNTSCLSGDYRKKFVLGAESETQKEIEKLSEKDQEIYQEELNRLLTQHKYSTSYPPFDLQIPKEPILHGLQNLFEGYTHEQACRFLALAKIQKSKNSNEMRIGIYSIVSREHVPPTVTTVTGHYALYRITERNENLAFHICEAYHKNIYEDDEELQKIQISHHISRIIDYQYSPNPHLYPGDTVAVKSVVRHAKTKDLKVLQFHIIDRKICKDRLFMELPNGKMTVLGFGAPVDILRHRLRDETVHRGDLFVPENWSPKICFGHNEAVEDDDEKKRCKQMPSIIHQPKCTDDKSTQHFINYISNRYSYDEDFLELVTVAGSTVAQAQKHGRYDDKMYITRISQIGNRIEFCLDINKRFCWYRGTRVVLSLPGQPDRIAFVTSMKEVKKESFDIRAKLRPGVGEVDQKLMTVYQCDMDAYPCLELGYFQNLPEGSNGKRIIQTLYGGSPMNEDNFDEPLELGDHRHYTPNHHQSQYLYSILSQAPITVGLFPFGSGKTLTAVWAAYLASILNPRSQHILIARNHLRSMDLVRKLSNVRGNGTYVRMVSDDMREIERTEMDIDKVMVAKMIEMLKMSEQNSILNGTLHHAAAHLIHHNHIRQEDLPDGFPNTFTTNLEILESSYWVRKFFRLFPPTIVICTPEDIRSPDFGPLENVETVQFDETTPTSKIELVTVCQKWPNAKFGLMGDLNSLSTPSSSLEHVAYEPVPWGLFPEVRSDIVYRGNPSLLEHVLGLKVRLEGRLESRIRIHEASDFGQAVIDIARELSPSISLGILFLYRSLFELPDLQQKFTRGTASEFIGSSKDVVIVSTREVIGEKDDWKKTGQFLCTALTTARKETILVGNVAEMRKTKIWRKVVEFVERNNQ